MRIFLYEYLTGGGTLDGHLGGLPSGSLLREGAAMITALASDFAQLPGVDVQLLRDARLPPEILDGLPARNVRCESEENRAFCELAATADATIVIAPEFDEILLLRCRWAEASAARLLSPSWAFVAISGDKQATAAALSAAGVPTPLACRLAPGQDLPSSFAYPAVLKPRYGAGSMDARYVADWSEASRLAPVTAERRLETFCPGIPASVSFLCGPGLRLPLPACRQFISADGQFRYLGGVLPLPSELCRRAQQMALRALESLPPAIGYVGVDLVLGAEPSGVDDVVLEVNPRLTTSYVGLRRLCRDNLASAMLKAAGGEILELSWEEMTVNFDADGFVRIDVERRIGNEL